MASRENSSHEALLLLPCTLSNSFASLKAAYQPALSIILAELSSPIKGTSGKAVLDIAITARGLAVPESAPRRRAFVHLQQLLASFYRLLGVTSVAQSVELDGPGGVDARVFFLDDSGNGNDDNGLGHGNSQMGPIIHLTDMVVSGRSWETVFSLETREGDMILSALTTTAKRQGLSNPVSTIRRLPGIPELQMPTNIFEQPDLHPRRHYSVAVGGTFDHLHVGHKLLLTATALVIDAVPSGPEPIQRTITIGITGDELLVNKKYAEYLESWDDRWQGVWTFMESIIDFSPPFADRAATQMATTKIEHVHYPGPNGKYVRVRVSSDLDIKFVQISDPFGPTITDEAISALVVSKETRSGGKAVNDEREKKGWSKLEIFEVDVLDSSAAEIQGEAVDNFETKISSTEIRRRQMNIAKGNL
ncbi:pantetheine-phosphate adenylyltransferase [Histoplasma capsulatum var. duboisii H88]|uniref:Pantetheine-phosphate adenylyltransferase n=2 Tax=Ajellomyces capsulatus TaxID=5037 RepID=F0U4S1_AJEC8|nr:pantetheine-phosphate adenylyltransferase [Histoplasma capsulatum H143]EGC41175.1 pantetheine-phosphate adenylyltransferase [Histoplasma capsulatum var. duboisii H88]QSS52403.1 pantetheine-phosphate adenylyltransferase [Histoplasma capsulatum var. duboisii H88]